MIFSVVSIVFFFLTFLCWGSFLNVVAYRVTYDKPLFTKRSYCPHCNKVVAWYDNIPVISWIILRARCRRCKKAISILYPFIEIITAVILTLVFVRFVPEYVYSKGLFLSASSGRMFANFFSYFLFFSALIISVRTDLEEMIIPQMVSLWLVPVGILFSFLGMTGTHPVDSIFGALFGYGSLWIVGKVFYWIKKTDGIGVGDMELLAMIGSFLGLLGVWFTILIGSISALFIGGGYLYFSGKGRNAKMPFGPFLVLGATIFFFFRNAIINLLIL